MGHTEKDDLIDPNSYFLESLPLPGNRREFLIQVFHMISKAKQKQHEVYDVLINKTVSQT